MRVCFVSIQWPPIITGGSGVAVVNLARELARNHKLTVYTFGLKDLAEEEIMDLDGAKIRVIRIFTSDSDRIATPFDGTKEDEIRRLLEFASKLLENIDCSWCDVIHLHGHFVVPGIARVLRELHCGRAIISTIHAFESLIELEKGRFSSPPSVFNTIVTMERDALEYSDFVTVASHSLLKRVTQIHGPQYLRRVRVIHMGIDDKLFEEPVDNDYVSRIRNTYLGSRGGLLFNLNRIDPHKGIEYIIGALSHIDTYSLSLVIAGKYEERNQSYLEMLMERKRAIEETSSHRITILRNIDERTKICLFDAADIFVMASPTEAFGLTILEALARKTPVIVTDAEGPREIFDVYDDIKEKFVEIDGGLMVNFSDPQKREKNLAAAIVYMLDNINHFKKKAEKTSKSIREKFSWRTISYEFESLYREALHT